MKDEVFAVGRAGVMSRGVVGQRKRGINTKKDSLRKNQGLSWVAWWIGFFCGGKKEAVLDEESQVKRSIALESMYIWIVLARVEI